MYAMLYTVYIYLNVIFLVVDAINTERERESPFTHRYTERERE